MITIVCAWCKKVLGVKCPEASDAVSHGVCQECYKGLLEQTGSVPVTPERSQATG